MAGDDAARRNVAAGTDLPPAPGEAEPSSGDAWPGQQGHRRPSWPVYGARSGRSDGVDDGLVVPAARPARARLVAVVAGSVMLAATVGAVLSRAPAEPDASPPARSEPRPVPPAGPQWTPADASSAAGLVRVQVTATVEADGIVLTDDGLVATSYARLVGFHTSPTLIEAIELNVVADGGMPMRAGIIGFDAARDVAVLRVPGYKPSSVATPGAPVETGDTLTLLDDQGGDQPIVAYPVTVSATKQQCSRAGAAMISRPRGFTFPLDPATAEPGGAVVRDDGTVVGMYYGGDSETHCAVPIAEVAAVVRDVERGNETSTTRVGPPGGLGIQLYGPDDTYPEVTSIDVVGGLAEAAGLRKGDVLTRVGDLSLRREDLSTLGPDGVIRSLEPGEKVTIEWRSGGTARRAMVEVGVGPEPRG